MLLLRLEDCLLLLGGHSHTLCFSFEEAGHALYIRRSWKEVSINTVSNYFLRNFINQVFTSSNHLLTFGNSGFAYVNFSVICGNIILVCLYFCHDLLSLTSELL